MDSIHQGPQFIPGSIQQGKTLSGTQLAKLEAHPKAAGFQQLCFFHPAANRHIASGVTKADLKQLQEASEGLSKNNPPVIGQLLVTKARNILIASGINHRNFSPEQQIHLAHLLGQGIVSGDWAHAINSALANGCLTSDLVDNLIHAKMKGWEMVLDIIHSAVGNNADLSALNTHEMHQLAGLLLHEQSPISGDWIEQHAEALAAGGITHTDFQAILTQAKESADVAAFKVAEKKLKDIAPKVDNKKKVDDAPSLHEKGFAHAFKQHASGFHSMSASWHTYIASHIAQQAIGEDGKVDDAAIARMREEVQSDTFRQTGPKDPQRAHVLAMLDALESNDQGIRDILESINAPQNPATSKAAEKIRSTLGLPPDTLITPKHARQAALSTLFASMRQHNYVGSCFATAVAIRVHDNDPARLLREIKSLIEHDCIEIEQPHANIEVPIATSVNVSPLRKALDINVHDDPEESYAIIQQIGATPIEETLPLHQIPGVQAALNALGIDEEDHNDVILEAVKTTGTDKTSLEAILKQVIKNQGLEGKDARTQFARAADAFEAQENNALLRSWEYTLATFSGPRIAARNINSLKNAIIGVKIPGSKQKLLDGINDILKSVPDIGSQNIQINMRIQREFRTLLGNRIQARFHPSYSDLSETSESGWELYYTNRNGEEVSIQTDEDFKEYILETFEISCEQVKAYLSDESRSFQQQRQGADFPIEDLSSHLRNVLNKEGLVESIVSGVNNERGKKVLHREPAWFIRSGGFETDVLQGYYGTPSAGKTTTAHTRSIKVLGNDFPSQLVNNIKKGIEASGLTSLPKNITTGVPGHVLNIVTQADPKMQAILESETPLTEIKALFYEPGAALYDKNLSEGEIRNVVEQVLTSANGSPVGDDTIDALLPDIMEDLEASNATGKPRELRATLGRLLKSKIEDGSITEGILDTIFIRAINPPAIAFADKNYFDNNGLGNGYVSFLFNPITGNVELWDTLNTGDGFTPVCPTDKFYQEASWNMYIHPDFYPEIQEVAKED